MVLKVLRCIAITLGCVVLVLGYAAQESQAQLLLQASNFPNGQPFDVSGYPVLRARVRALYAGQPRAIEASHWVIRESNLVIAPTNVQDEGNGIHIITWTTNVFLLASGIVTAYEGPWSSSISFSEMVDSTRGAVVIVRDSISKKVPYYLDFETVPAGTTDTLKVKVVVQRAAKESPGSPAERRVRLDSVYVRTPNFKVIWKGSFSAPQPPTNILSPLEYRVDVVCQPTTNEPISDVLSVVFEGGMKYNVVLTANPTTYPRRTILNVIQPNGGEAFAPCQKINIKWKGAIPGFPAFIEYSTNNGKRWSEIGSTQDSTFLWDVPATISDSCKIRVFQQYSASESYFLEGENVAALSSAFSADGRYLMVCYTNGKAIEFDVATRKQVQSYDLNKAGNTVGPVVYVGNTREIIVCMTRTAGGGILQHYANGNSTPLQSVVVPTDIVVRGLACDASGGTIWVLGQSGGRLVRFNSADLVQGAHIETQGSIASSGFNNNILTVSLLNGVIKQYNATTGDLLQEFDTKSLQAQGPAAARVASTTTGRLVAIAGLNANEQRTFIYDIQTQRLVKIIFRESTDPVALQFSANDAFLAVGTKAAPQFTLFDLVKGTRLSLDENAAGHNNSMTDLRFSPDGATMVSTSVDSTRNVLLRRIVTPESDESDSLFSISQPQLASSVLFLGNQFIGEQKDTTVTARLCNTGKAPAIFSGYRVANQRFASVTNSATDTLYAGDCRDLVFRLFPRDTGKLADQLLVDFCGTTASIPLELLSFDRQLGLPNEIVNFGDVCVGDRKTLAIRAVRNGNNIPILINRFRAQGGVKDQFQPIKFAVDTALNTNDSMFIEVEFSPLRFGYDTSYIEVLYGDQENVVQRFAVAGRGSGADLAPSHPRLAFIEEIPERVVMLRNGSDNPITITGSTITDSAPFTVITPLPLIIAAKDSLAITIRYNGGAVPAGAYATFAVEPCPAANRVYLELYSSTTELSVDTVSGDPRGKQRFTIRNRISDSTAYNGKRFCEFTLQMNPRLFLASSVSTPISGGNASIVSQEIVNDIRNVVVRVEANFDTSSIIAVLEGYVGTAEVDSTVIQVDTSVAKNYGKAVKVIPYPGLLRVVHEHPTRRIIQQKKISIINVAPQPASENVTVSMNAELDEAATIVMVDALQSNVFQQSISLQKGSNAVMIPCSDLPAGVYAVYVQSNSSAAFTNITIVR